MSKSKWHRIRWKLLVILALALVAFLFSTWSEYLQKPPLQESISLDPPSSIEREIRVPVPEQYALELEFSRDGHSVEEVKSLVGDLIERTAGIAVPIQWSISSVRSGNVVASGKSYSVGSSGWSNDSVSRSIATVRVEPGRYKFRAQIDEPVPELAKLSPKIVPSFNFKTATTWQMNVSTLGTFVIVFLFPVIAGPLLVWIVFDLLRSLRESSVG